MRTNSQTSQLLPFLIQFTCYLTSLLIWLDENVKIKIKTLLLYFAFLLLQLFLHRIMN